MRDVTSFQASVPASSVSDELTEVLKRGAQKLLATAIEEEVASYIEHHSGALDEDGHRLVVRNGYLPKRTIQTGIGEVQVRQPRVQDGRLDPNGDRIRFTSKILPPYLRKTRTLDAMIPWLYLKGISTNGFSEALQALLGPEAPGLSPNSIVRLKQAWEADYQEWNQRSFKGKRYVYFWADGIHFNIRLEEGRSCILVVMGATAEGKNALSFKVPKPAVNLEFLIFTRRG